MKSIFRLIFLGNHNEVWKIWSDVFPLMYFIIEMCISSNEVTKYGLYFGIISSKICSIIYHCSLNYQETLIYIDLIGIANMVFGIPFIGTKISEKMHINYYSIYVMYIITVSIYCYFLYNMIPFHQTQLFSQCLIVCLGLIANIPICYIIIVHYTEHILFVYANLNVLLSYVLFYLLQIPDRFLGIKFCEGKIWNSHVLWHLGVSITQYMYLQI
jgi:hypothetical protein